MTTDQTSNNVTPLFKGVDQRLAPATPYLPVPLTVQIVDSMKRVVKATDGVLALIDDGTFFDDRNPASIDKTCKAIDELEASHDALKAQGF